MPKSTLGSLLKKAKLHNHLSALLNKEIPPQLKGLTLCLVEQQKVVLIAENSTIAFRAEKQKKLLLEIINRVEGMPQIQAISIKVDIKKY